MNTEPELVPGTDIKKADEIVNPLSGELVAWTDTAACATVLDDLRRHKDKVLDAIKVFEAAILDASTRQGTKTLRFFGEGRVREAVVTGGPKLEWDVSVLEELRDAGLPEERFSELVSIEQTFKVDSRVAKQLESANPAYGEIIGRARSYTPKPHRIKVS